MDAGKRRPELTGTWLRSFEEETEDDLVFRPPDFPFPPARAPRPALRLDQDGTAVALHPGPGDRPEPQPGSEPGHWAVHESTLSLRTAQLSGDFTLDVVTADRLVVRRRKPT